MKTYFEKHHRIIGTLGALASLVIAIVYLLVTPEEITWVNWIQNAILSYAHSVCWFLLSAASALWAVKQKNKWSVRLMYGALLIYGLFIGTLLLT